MLKEDWENYTWVNDDKYTYTYDTNGNLTEELHQRGYGNTWNYFESETFMYDLNGYLVEEIVHGAGTHGDSGEDYKRIYAYDVSGNLLEILQQRLEEFVAVIEDISLPRKFKLSQNYPNPFNPVTTIQYNLPQRSDVQIAVYDLIGRKVTTLLSETQDAGYKSIIWNATNTQGQPVSAGVYFYQIQARLRSVSYDGQAGEFVQTRKMMVLK